jgi:hypothetical protein
MRDGHVWCIGSAREREKAGEKAGAHRRVGNVQVRRRWEGRTEFWKVGGPEPRLSGGAGLRWRSPAPLWAPPGHLGYCHVAGMAVPDCSFTPASSPPLTQTHASNWHVARTHGERGAQIRHSRYIRPLKPDETRVRQMSCGPRCGTCWFLPSSPHPTNLPRTPGAPRAPTHLPRRRGRRLPGGWSEINQ